MTRKPDKKSAAAQKLSYGSPPKQSVHPSSAERARHLDKLVSAPKHPQARRRSWLGAILVVIIAVFAMWLIPYFLSENGYQMHRGTYLSITLALVGWGILYALVRSCEACVRNVLLRFPKSALPVSVIAFYSALVFASLSAFGRLGAFWRDVIHNPVARDLDWASWFPTLAVTVINTLVIFALTTAWLYRPISSTASLAERRRWKTVFLFLTLAALAYWFWIFFPLISGWPRVTETLSFSEQGQQILPTSVPHAGFDLICVAAVTVILLLFVPLIVLGIRPASSPIEISLPTRRFRRLQLPAPFSWYTVIAVFGGVMAFVVDSITGQRELSIAILFGWFLLPLLLLAGARFIRSVWHYLFPGAWRANFYEHIALAAESGYPLHEAVRSFLISEALLRVKGQISPLLFYLERGHSLEKAAAFAFGFFSAAEAAAIASARDEVDLARMLRYLADGQRQRRRFREGRKTLSVYLLETFFAIVLTSFLWQTVIPRYLEISSYFVPKSSLSLDFFEFTASAAVHAAWLLPALVIGFFVGRVAFLHSMNFRRLVARIVPPLAEVWWASALGRLVQSLSIQLSKQVPVESAVETAVFASGDPALARQVPVLTAHLRCGKPLHRAFAALRGLPSWFKVHLAMGAKHENLPSLLAVLAQNYQRRALCLTAMLEMLLSVLLIIATVSFFVCFVASFYIVMFSVYKFFPYE